MAGRTYRYATETPQFPFGFGLGYTRFVYRNVQAPEQISAADTLAVQVKLTNAGKVAGEEVVQLYLSKAEPAPSDPLYTLIAFQRVALAAGETRTVAFSLAPDRLATVDDAGQAAVQPGAYKLIAGGSSPGLRSAALGAATPVEASFSIAG